MRGDASRKFGVTTQKNCCSCRGLAQPGVSQTSKGGLENGVHTPAVSWGLDSISLYLDSHSSTPLSHYLLGRNPMLLPGQETPGTTRKENGKFPVYFCVGPTPVHSRRGNGYRKLGTCRQGIQPRKCAHACIGVKFPADDSQEQEQHSRESVHMHALASNFLSTTLMSKSDKGLFSAVYFAEGSVGRSPCAVRPSNDGGQILPLPAL